LFSLQQSLDSLHWCPIWDAEVRFGCDMKKTSFTEQCL